MTMQPHEYKAAESRRKNVVAANRQWMQDWGSGLAYCNDCGHEYVDLQAVTIDNESSCPGCKKPEWKTYYYCAEHGDSQCPECRDNK